MELYDLKFSDTIRFSVTDIDDYNIKGTFDPQSACDTEFFGYRETTFKVENVEIKDGITKYWWPFDAVRLEYFSTFNDSALTLIVQNEIDKQNGEY